MKSIFVLYCFLIFPITISAQELPVNKEATNQKEANSKDMIQEYPKSDCIMLYREIENDLDKSNYCEQDGDCKTLELGGPFVKFGCFHFINNAVNGEEIYSKMERYYRQCSNVINECSPSPKPICVNKKCIYEGEKNDSLTPK
jgi:hypothetical protein